MGDLSRYEMETVINFNAEEKTATVYTRDKSILRRIDALCQGFPDIFKVIAEDSISRTYEVPKKLIKVAAPRVMSDEQKEELRARFAKVREASDGESNDD